MSSLPREIVDELRPVVRTIDLSAPRSVHIIGIGGAGMRAIARVLLQMGHQVSGSDRAASSYIEDLKDLGAAVSIGQSPDAAADADMVTRSTAVPDTDADVRAAVSAGTPVYSRAEMLAAIVQQRPAVLVAGTHGKTTTSSMLAVVLEHAGLSPSFVIGSDVASFGTGARWGDTDVFVVEADESDGTFLALTGAHAIVTSLDPDHLEFYGTAERLEAAFIGFVDTIAGTTAVCVDDPDTHCLLGRAGVITYGTSSEADLRIADVTIGADSTSFAVWWHGTFMGEVTVGLPGHHNALNAAGAAVIALSLGVDFDAVGAGLAAFGGVARRFETRGEHVGVRFVDDYAHLPAEVEAAVATAVAGSWNRVIASYQPHRYSRTEALGATFAESFRGVDELVLTEIYPSGESPRQGVSGRIVFDAVTAACPDLKVTWLPDLDQVTEYLAASVGPGDLCLTLGAGDLTTVPDRVLSRLRSMSPGSIDWLHDVAPQLGSTHIEFGGALGIHTTYRVGGAALALASVDTIADLEILVATAAQANTPVVMVGKGSNMLVADRGFHGLAVTLGDEFEQISIDGSTVKLGAAVSLPVAARRTVASSLAGFEWAVGVPGSLGGAIVMNAGGHGSDMAASVTQCEVLNLTTGQRSTLLSSDLSFGYRHSAIGPDHVVIEATLELEQVDSPGEGEDLLSEIVRWRREHQPGGQNAGSVFTNPPDDSAGRLIDAAGGKGLRVGSASVSEKHANFIQVEPGGRADDVRQLMRRIVDLVRDHAGIELEAETRLVGFINE